MPTRARRCRRSRDRPKNLQRFRMARLGAAIGRCSVLGSATINCLPCQIIQLEGGFQLFVASGWHTRTTTIIGGGVTMMRLQEVPEEFRPQFEIEQRQRREYVRAVLAACSCGDAEQFYALIGPCDHRPWASWNWRFGRSPATSPRSRPRSRPPSGRLESAGGRPTGFRGPPSWWRRRGLRGITASGQPAA